mgnify:CR=1 FL=1
MNINNDLIGGIEKPTKHKETVQETILNIELVCLRILILIGVFPILILFAKHLEIYGIFLLK